MGVKTKEQEAKQERGASWNMRGREKSVVRRRWKTLDLKNEREERESPCSGSVVHSFR